MLAPAIGFGQLDPRVWSNLQRLFFARPVSHQPSLPRTVFLLLHRRHIIDAWQADRGALPIDSLVWLGPTSLPRLRRELNADMLIAFEEEAPLRIWTAFARATTPDDDGAAQGLALWRAIRGELGRGLFVDPDLLSLVPLPSYAALQHTLDGLIPDDRSAALFVFEGDALWASILAEKRHGDIVRVDTAAALELRRPAFRHGAHREILDALARRLARPHIAGFCSLEAWRDVLGPRPGALARQLTLGAAVIDPLPPWLMALGGMGAMAGVAQGASKLLGRFVPQAVKDTARALSPFGFLGFDPVALFLRLREAVLTFAGGPPPPR